MWKPVGKSFFSINTWPKTPFRFYKYIRDPSLKSTFGLLFNKSFSSVWVAKFWLGLEVKLQWINSIHSCLFFIKDSSGFIYLEKLIFCEILRFIMILGTSNADYFATFIVIQDTVTSWICMWIYNNVLIVLINWINLYQVFWCTHRLSSYLRHSLCDFQLNYINESRLNIIEILSIKPWCVIIFPNIVSLPNLEFYTESPPSYLFYLFY